MTVSTQHNRKTYTGDGAQTVFPYDFLLLDQTHLEVYVDGTKKTLTTDYTVSGVGNPAGGNVTIIVAPASGKQVLILRVVPLKQEVDLLPGGALPADTVEQQVFDRLTMIAQQIQEALDRTIKLAKTSLLTNIDFPEGANKFIRWDSLGTKLEAVAIATMGLIGIPVSVADGGTGATTAAGARTNLGLPIGLKAKAKTVPAMSVDVEAGTFLKSDGSITVSYSGGTSPTVSAPAANPRIDVLTIADSGTLAWTTGTEAASPVAPTYPADKVPIAEVYLRVGATSIKDTDDGTNGYVNRDVRPFLQNKSVVSRARAVRTSAQSIPNAAWTKATYTAEEYDGAAEFDSTTNHRFVSGVAGGKRIEGNGVFAGVAGGIRELQLYKNGGGLTPQIKLLIDGTAADSNGLSISTTLEDILNDYYELFVYQDTGGALNLNGAAFSIARVW